MRSQRVVVLGGKTGQTTCEHGLAIAQVRGVKGPNGAYMPVAMIKGSHKACLMFAVFDLLLTGLLDHPQVEDGLCHLCNSSVWSLLLHHGRT